jgi:hypothetical protein
MSYVMVLFLSLPYFDRNMCFNFSIGHFFKHYEKFNNVHFTNSWVSVLYQFNYSHFLISHNALYSSEMVSYVMGDNHRVIITRGGVIV